MARERVLPGMRPTGRLHLGDVLGALDGIRERRTAVAADPARIREVPEDGAARARRTADQTLAGAKAAIRIL